MRAPRPVFLPAPGYRRRRLHDAARLVPVFGLVLFLVPLLWTPAAGGVRATAPDAIYLFAVWAGLIAVAGLLSRGLGKPAPAADQLLPDPASDPARDPARDPASGDAERGDD